MPTILFRSTAIQPDAAPITNTTQGENKSMSYMSVLY